MRTLTEKMAPAAYGQLALALTAGTVVTQVIFGGLTNGLTRFYSIAMNDGDSEGFLRASLTLVAVASAVGIGLTAFFFVLIPVTSSCVSPSTLILVFLTSLLTTYNTLLLGLQTAARRRAVAALHSGAEPWARLTLALGSITLFPISVPTVLLGFAASASLLLLSNLYFFTRLPLEQSPHQLKTKNRPWVREIWSFSWPFSLWGTFTWIHLSADRWALGLFSTPSCIGEYAAAYQLGFAPIALLAGLMTSLFGPVFYASLGQACNAAGVEAVYSKTWVLVRISLALTFATFILSSVFHRSIAPIVFAAEYRSASAYLPWLLLAGGLFASGQLLALQLMAQLRTQALVPIKISTACIGTITHFVGAYFYGVVGILVSLLLFCLLYFLWLSALSTNSRSPQSAMP